MMDIVLLAAIGIAAGLLSGVFGIGGGVLIVPALIYGMRFSPGLATGTSLAVLLPPVGLAAVLQYYQQGKVDLRAAMLIAVAMLIGAWIGARVALQIDARAMKGLFGVFLIVLGAYVIFESRQ